MAKTPMLSARQWRTIEPYLPVSRRDVRMISAILYRNVSGQSLRDVAAAFDVTRSRMSEWESVLADALPTILRKLNLEGANPRVWRAGGPDWRKRNPGMYKRVTLLRLRNFRDALKAD